jgi:hypothetical protein
MDLPWALGMLNTGGRATMLIGLPHGRGLQLNDRPPDPKPNKLLVAIAAFEHLIRSPGSHNLSLGFMATDQKVGGSPDVAIGDHSGSTRSAALLPSTKLVSAGCRLLIAPRQYHTG